MRDDWNFALSDIRFVGANLSRPECVLAAASGDLFVSALGNGVIRIAPDGNQTPIGKIDQVDGLPFIANGIALEADGSFLIANIGEAGGIWRLRANGHMEAVVREVDGVTLRAANFVLRDPLGRLWATVSTRRWPLARAFCPLDGPLIADGYVVLIDKGEARIVADNLCFANEIRFDRSGSKVFVVESYARRISCFSVAANGALDGREVFTQFGHGTIPDGIAFDSQGHLWVTSLLSNRLFRVAPDGGQHLLLEDNDPDHLALVEDRLSAGTLQSEDMRNAPSRVLRNIASIAFGGPDLRTVYLGSLGGDRIAMLRSPVAGEPMPHWNFAAR